MKISHILALGVVSASSASPAMADWFFRGTANTWAASALTQVSANTYETCQQFGAGDAGGGPRFKIDRLGDWSENYPAADYQVSANTAYSIAFNSSTKAINATQVASCSAASFSKIFPSLYFRGTPNAWAATPMELVANNTWQLQIHFDGQTNQRFKVDVSGNWSQNYGDTNGDGYLNQAGADISLTGQGDYLLTVNDQTLQYTLQSVACTSNCGAAADTLGAVYDAEGTTFSLWSPDASNVALVLEGVNHAMTKVTSFNGYSEVYQVRVEGDLHLAEYYFTVNGNRVRDPYGKMAVPQSDTNIVMDMARTEPLGGWASVPALNKREDAIIYEVHMRDFTIHPSSGVDAAKRGKYLGMVQAGTKYNGVKTGIDHLKELGVTHVQLLPVYDYATCDGLPDSDPCYNWGYDPRNFNVPEERYSQTPLDYENRAREFKTLVNELHKAGIRVVMDVVYNHTYAKEMFDKISGKYYTPTDLSGTGNSIDADVPMVSRMIQDSLQYWVEEYKIDGFRFDLIGIFSHAEVEKWGAHLNSQFPDRNLLLYGEPWNGYASDPKEGQRVRYGTTRFMAEEHVGVFNGAYREAIKGNNDGTATGFMFNNLSAADSGWAIYDGMRGSPYNSNDGRNGTWFRNYTADPEQSINYISAHDNFGLWDKVYLSLSSNVVQNGSHQIMSLTPPADLAYPKRVVNFGMGQIFTSQGIAFVHAGDEFLRTKTADEQIATASAWNYGQHGGTHNTYNSPDSFNSIKWHNKVNNAPTFNYFRDLISLRKAHAGLRMNTNAEIAQYMALSRPAEFGGQVVTGHITYPSDSHNLFVVYNSGNNVYVNLPTGNWTRVADANGAANAAGLSGTALVEGSAVTVFSQAR
ncbi:alpha-amylase family glycosyl hydrolase [Simiduia curdlanivorans]|uniref:Alpha-amylase family glycosyl hydrolase n=1 Tax=Simiduia curdlanivorans TaxID=1492769 RepID=A0ABV8V4C2_9GAMM|nr:alpha-amylase family glycosyl hydrolase [Simiduia curdlanivorans]MDN3637385.1 alpha-amylase family glycosyl hydrolase [Simiduia curdlanivorans]